MPNTGTRANHHLLILLAGALACVLAALFGQYRGGSSLYFFRDVKGSARPLEGAMTAVSGFLLVAAATCLALFAHRLSRQSQRRVGAFAVFAGLLLVMAFDEVMTVHEWIAVKLSAASVPVPLGTDADIYVFLGYGLVGLPCLLLMLPVLRPDHRARRLLLAMIAFGLGSQALDFVPWTSLTPRQQSWLGPIEEGLKTMAALAGCMCGWFLLTRSEPDRPAPTPTPVQLPDRAQRPQRATATSCSERDN